MPALEFDTAFEPRYGEAVAVAPQVARITVRNPGAFTFAGTNSYIVGTSSLAVIDPGPDDEDHLEALMRAIAGRPVSHILVSHTHADHSPLTRRLKQATGALVLAEGPHRAARALRDGEVNPFEAAADLAFAPDRALADGETVEGDGWRLETVLTPGHTMNHACFALAGTGILFSADHVMAWATSIVAPPDGTMSAYMASLEKLLARDDSLLLPGHGGPVRQPRPFLRGLKAHRKMRERAIRQRLHAGDETIGEIVAAIYRDTDQRLHGAAALSVQAHLEDLVARGKATADPAPLIDARYRLTQPV